MRVIGLRSLQSNISRQSFRQHCDALIAMYTKVGEASDQLAKGHRAIVK